MMKLKTIVTAIVMVVCSQLYAEEALENVSLDLMTLGFESSEIRKVYIGEDKAPLDVFQAEFSRPLKYTGLNKVPVYLSPESEEPDTWVILQPDWKEVIWVVTSSQEKKRKKSIKIFPAGFKERLNSANAPAMIFNATGVPIYCLFDNEKVQIDRDSLYKANFNKSKKRTRLAIGVYSLEDQKHGIIFSDRVRLWKDHCLFMIVVRNNYDPNDEAIRSSAPILVIKANRYVGGNK